MLQDVGAILSDGATHMKPNLRVGGIRKKYSELKVTHLKISTRKNCSLNLRQARFWIRRILYSYFLQNKHKT
jgi:hypothetical protein